MIGTLFAVTDESRRADSVHGRNTNKRGMGSIGAILRNRDRYVHTSSISSCKAADSWCPR